MSDLYKLISSGYFWGELGLITLITFVSVIALAAFVKMGNVKMASFGKIDFWKEVIVIGVMGAVLTAAIGFVVSDRMTPVFDKLNLTYENNRGLIMSSVLLITGFLVGAVFHIGFEVSLLHDYYCEYGFACNNLKKK